MSINHFLNKIKSYLGIDNFHLVFFLVIVGVSLSSFALGRISISKTDNNNQIEENNFYLKNENEKGIEGEDFSTNNKEEKKYVASKNGKLYYSLNCSGANRIKEENKIFFASKEEAEKSGYGFATSCN
ncbi:TPA: hypothetical protein DIC38_03090 [Candidatus Nomurabacteria bacterium]|nr:MAG: hypothetical protein O210_OD1C00001G0165 [Parcubacteria bacterium RAAC4_OD1_1]HCY26638.1 hypothetical protein [Candidatus Nomurabacteria bacterium]